MNTTTKNEYRPIAERKAPADMTLPELVREFASLRVQAHWAPSLREAGSHRRLDAVVTELEKRGALD